MAAATVDALFQAIDDGFVEDRGHERLEVDTDIDDAAFECRRRGGVCHQ